MSVGWRGAYPDGRNFRWGRRAGSRPTDPRRGDDMKTQYYTATSLDGFIATEEDSLDWLFPLGDINSTGYPAFIAEVGALAMGSATYEWMLRHAQTVAAEA